MRPLIAFALVLLLGTVRGSAAGEYAYASVAVTATFSTRTGLDVSTQTLHFDATAAGQPATATVAFAAKARTGSGSEVMLSVEPVRSLEGPGGASDVDASVTFEGKGDGTTHGRLTPAKPVIVGRWVGSGRRVGRLIFALRAPARGRYVLPVRFVLTAP